jgi:pimeloyl-ACP methyl ester carboxylesterase
LDELIPFEDFGGSTEQNKPVLHFAHPNAYAPACFRQFLSPFFADYRVLAVKHRPLWPESQPEALRSWRQISDDLLRFFEQQQLRNVIGVGHSLGAVATLYAAQERPELFSALVLIEPIFLPPVVLEALTAEPALMESFPLLQTTRVRRQAWPSRQVAFEHFRAKGAFQRWSDEALWDFINHGLREDGERGGVRLAFSREWETRFYARPPLDVWEVLPQVSLPTLAIRGVDSDSLFPEAWGLWQTLQPQTTFVEMGDAGHMVTMEGPGGVAELVLNFLQR